MSDPLPDWRAVWHEGWHAADWPWAFRYIPRYGNMTPNLGNGLHYVDDAYPRWTQGVYSLAADRAPSYVLLDSTIYQARWWMSPDDTGGLGPDDGLTRIGVGIDLAGVDPIAFYIRSWGGGEGGMGAWRCDPFTAMGWDALLYMYWNTPWDGYLPVGLPAFGLYGVGWASFIGPTRRPYNGRLIVPTGTLFTSLDLTYVGV